MHVCVDFDGVLADTSVAKKRWIEAYTGRLVETTVDRSTILSLIDEDSYQTMQEQVGFEDTLLAPPMSGVGQVLERLTRISSIVIVSARPPVKMIWAERWLIREGLMPMVKAIHSAHHCAKADIARAYGGGWLVDDDVRHASGLSSDTKFLHFGRQGRVHGGFLVARDWMHVESIILSR